MEKKDIIKTMGTLKVAYPNSFKSLSEADMNIMIELWYTQFLKYSYQDVLNSINYIIANDDTNFMPSIARIKQVIKEHTQTVNVSQIAEKSDLECLSLKELEKMVYEKFYPNLKIGE